MAFDLDTALETALALGASDLHVKVPAVPACADQRPAARAARASSRSRPRTPRPVASACCAARRSSSSSTRPARSTSPTSPPTAASASPRSPSAARPPSSSARSRPRRATETLGLPPTVLRLGRRAARPGRDHRPHRLGQEHHRRRSDRPREPDPPGATSSRSRTRSSSCTPTPRPIVTQREIGLDAPTYHVALRAALRQDPDVILIGEVRDEETAMTALRAAETGHLVLCTMHTINAAETVQRFIDLFGDRQAIARAPDALGDAGGHLLPAARAGRRRRPDAQLRGARELLAHARPDRQRRDPDRGRQGGQGGRLLRHAHLRPVPARPRPRAAPSRARTPSPTPPTSTTSS